ncbi:protein PHLOEM PROTEIN 2-LIKE A1 [Elaeis guineensis]|uniref:Protein PHLOEM PROTEIN 2-LIKE A1 n=1 Tax=Elaeis guineensis var. tenera TaxID=51953 RepID=A0A6I9SEF0_ELAGV|nr:protein PHLOEM PROTEIN 2-LIKE A1 [Elaeis guineensis]
MASIFPMELFGSHLNVRPGVFIGYWKKEEANNIYSFTLYPRALDISGSDEPDVWRWSWSESDPRIEVEVAELLVGHDLVVNGIFEMSHLTPGKKYEIFYMLYFKNPPAFEPRFSVTLQLPKGKPIVTERPLKIGPEGRAVVEGGEFVASADGQVKFSLANPDHLEWKKGLTIVGVSIRKSRLDAVV